MIVPHSPYAAEFAEGRPDSGQPERFKGRIITISEYILLVNNDGSKKKRNSGEKVPLGNYNVLLLYSIADNAVSPNQGETARRVDRAHRSYRGGGGGRGGGRSIFRDPLLSVYVSLSQRRRGSPDLKACKRDKQTNKQTSKFTKNNNMLRRL